MFGDRLETVATTHVRSRHEVSNISSHMTSTHLHLTVLQQFLLFFISKRVVDKFVSREGSRFPNLLAPKVQLTAISDGLDISMSTNMSY